MRLLPHALAVVLALGVGCSAQDSKKEEPKETKRPKFWIGDAVPSLAGAKWLQGEEIKFQSGKVYVVEFWATWCRPCIQSMPHLAKLQEEYGKKGLQILAVTTADEDGNNLASVSEFLKKNGSKFPFPFAFCPTDSVNTAWREDSGTDSLPSSFVVDAAGKLAFVGHPMDLDDVLPRVFAGAWKGQASIDEIEKEKSELDDILNLVQDAAVRAEKANAGKGAETVTKAVGDAAADAAAEVLRVLPNYEKKWPYKAKQPVFDAMKIAVALQARQFDAAAKLTEELHKKSVEAKDAHTLGQIRSFWSAKALNPDRKLVGHATAAADAVLKLEGEADLATLLGAVEAYYAAGKKATADGYADKARKLAGDDEKTKAAIEKAIQRYQQ